MSRCILLFALGVSNGEAGIGDDRQEDAKVLPTSKASLVRLGARFCIFALLFKDEDKLFVTSTLNIEMSACHTTSRISKFPSLPLNSKQYSAFLVGG
jgi:hypothetical protein